jgi:hypothetical protein
MRDNETNAMPRNSRRLASFLRIPFASVYPAVSVLRAMMVVCAAIVFVATMVSAGAVQQQTDLARYPEGNSRTLNTAQYLINRENLTRRAVQFGRLLFHREFAEDERSGCNGLPCVQRHKQARTGPPHSLFEASSCATCHSQPSGSAGFSESQHYTFTSDNTIRGPDMFGLGLIQQLGIEATEDLKAASRAGRPLVTANGVDYGSGLGVGAGRAIEPDLVVRPFGRKGVESHLRAFASRAAFNHLGLQAQDRFQCPAGDRDGDGRCDGPVKAGIDPDGDGSADELTQGGLSLLEHYLINYPVPGRGRVTEEVREGERLFKAIGCAECHRPGMRIRSDPRIEHLTVFWNEKNARFEAERRRLVRAVDDGYQDPDRMRAVLRAEPKREGLVVDLYSDLKRHDLGPQRADRSDEEGVNRSVFVTRPLWGVGSYTAFLSDGSAPTLEDAITRHGGEARSTTKRYTALPAAKRRAVTAFLKSLVLFSVDDVLTAKIPITAGDLP